MKEMAQYFFSADLGDNRSLFLSPLTDRWLAMSQDVIHDQSGYFLFEQSGIGNAASIDILAQVHSEDAVFKLQEMFKMT